MRAVIALLVTGVLTAGAACSAGGGSTTQHARPSSIGAAPTTAGVSATRAAPPTPAAARSSAFCAEAKRVGVRNLSPADPTSAADPAALLAGIDRLATIAPAQISSDFTMFDRFEHAILDTQHGRPSDLQKLNTPRLALQHVGSYLSGTCGISG